MTYEVDHNIKTDLEVLVARTDFELGWPRFPATEPPQA